LKSNILNKQNLIKISGLIIINNQLYALSGWSA